MTRGWRAALLLVLAVLLAGCTASAPQPPAPTPSAPPEPTQLVLGVDDLGPGFNPHLLAHRSPVTTALTTLVLPSVFRPDVDGVLQLDRTIATSAEVVSTDPFTVSYELNLEASWSSNAPIAAEDFVYLWERMRSEPGTADAAGYRLITDVRSRAGGKAVDVVFSEPYPAWQGLFSGLLPAHILKDAPGSWTGALAGGLPASGGPFRVASVDRARGEIVLTRNDLYWDAPAVLDQLVLRRLDRAALVDGLSVGDVDIGLPVDDPALRTALGGLQPAPRLQDAPQADVTQLAFRTEDGPLTDPRVRQAVGALVDREAVRTAVAPEALSADAFALAPSEPGYAPTAPEGAPARPDAAAAERLLDLAGWSRDGDDRWTDEGEPVRLVIGAAGERAQDVRVAEAVAAQLDAAGIATTVVAPPAVELFGQPTAVTPVPPSSTTPTPAPTSAETPATTPTPTASAGSAAAATTAPATPAPAAAVPVDVVVSPRPAGGDPATQLASDYGCTEPTALVPDPPVTLSGFCYSPLQALLDELVAGDPSDAAGTYAAVERVLWSQLPALPLFQPVTLLVSTASADAVTGVGPGPLGTGPVTGAQRWSAPAE